jgi:hypothetical protein
VPPPALDSAIWTEDLDEIRELGGSKSVRRTPGQTDIARFWFITGPQSWGPIVRQLIAPTRLDLIDAASVHALVVAAAAADALIAVFDAKYCYNFWRPITAIRNADLTGNKATPKLLLIGMAGSASLRDARRAGRQAGTRRLQSNASWGPPCNAWEISAHERRRQPVWIVDNRTRSNLRP